MRRQGIKIKDRGKHPPNPRIVLDAARHNLREIQAERGPDSHIDSRRTPENEVLAGPGSAAEVAALADQLMVRAGVDPKKFRLDGVRLVEVICSLPPDFKGDARAYFVDCLEWAGRHYAGAENIVSAVIHRDEAQLHLHVLLVPLQDGRMAGSQMASYYPAALKADQKSFHEEVASKHGLRRAARLSPANKAALSTAVTQHLRTQKDPAMTSQAWVAIRAAIDADPRPFAEALGVAVEPPSKRMRTVAQIMTSPGRGPKRELELYRGWAAKRG